MIAMPRMGCGLDRLEWTRVKEILSKTFADSGVVLDVYALAADQQ
jgi:hypothetical protein